MQSLRQLAWLAYKNTFPISIEPRQYSVPVEDLYEVIERAEHRRELWWLNAL